MSYRGSTIGLLSERGAGAELRTALVLDKNNRAGGRGL